MAPRSAALLRRAVAVALACALAASGCLLSLFGTAGPAGAAPAPQAAAARAAAGEGPAAGDGTHRTPAVAEGPAAGNGTHRTPAVAERGPLAAAPAGTAPPSSSATDGQCPSHPPVFASCGEPAGFAPPGPAGGPPADADLRWPEAADTAAPVRPHAPEPGTLQPDLHALSISRT